jgi:hypothetical protein
VRERTIIPIPTMARSRFRPARGLADRNARGLAFGRNTKMRSKAKAVVEMLPIVLAAWIPESNAGEFHWTTFSCGDFAGTNYIQVVSPRDATQWPMWNPEAGSCPLSVTQAVALARASIACLGAAGTVGELESILLDRNEESDLWFYQIAFRFPKQEQETHGANRLQIVVTLNGCVPQIRRNAGTRVVRETTVVTNGTSVTSKTSIRIESRSEPEPAR